MPMSKAEEALVFAAKNGNTKCFEELYKLYYEKIYALALTITKNSSDAEDVLQITFVKAWQNIDKLDNPSAFNTWLQRITINQCNSMLRGSKQNYSIDDEGENGELLQIESDLMLPEQYAEREDLSLRLKTIIDELSVVQRETILLYYFNDMSIEEIAQTMDCSEGTVKSRLHLARKAIKTEIEEQEKKTGEKFYGIAGVALIPFAGMFIKHIKSASLSGSEAANVFNRIGNTIFNTPLNPANVARLSDRAANAAQNTNAQPIQQVAESPVSSANTSTGVSVNAVSSASKSSFPLWAKIVSVAAGACVLIGGGIFAWNKLKPAPTNPIIDAVVGDEFTYGKYEQDNNTENGKENITWKVLERENDKLFVVSKYVLDCVTYEEYNPGFNWSDTGLRSSLDSDFYNNTFTEEEKKYISDAYVFSNEGNSSEKEDTVVIDKVFILNEFETDAYFSSNDERIAYATEYALANGVETDENNHAVWWLRSRAFENYIGAVYEDGNTDGERGGHSGSSFGLRPAMWIDTKAMAENHDAENVVHPVDTRYLNDSLHNFLKTFALHFMDGTYDCENITEDSNILHGVIGESECVDYGLYSEELAVENSYENWIDSREISSPIEEINNNRNPIYKKLDAPAVDNILTGIFHCTDDDIQKMRGWQSDWNPYGYADGYYYCSTGGHGDMGSEFTYSDGYYKDGCCYYTFDYYRSEALWTNNFSTEGISPSTKIYVKASLVAHEGKPWWSLYYYSQERYNEVVEENTKSTNTNTEDNLISTNYVMGDRLVEYNDVVYYADNEGLWKKESGSDSKLLVKCSAIHLTTNGNVIYYGAFNKTVEYPYSNRQIEVRQYDMYKYDLKSGTNSKVTSFIGDGEPICETEDVIYYTDYSDDFDGNAAGLAKGIRSYNTLTGEKEYIYDGAHLVDSYDEKIFYREIMAAGSGYGVHQIHLYDTKTGKSDTISEDAVRSFKVFSGKLYYVIDNNLNFGDNSSDIKICCYDISTGNTSVLFEKNEQSGVLHAYDDKYAIYSNGSQKYYRVNLASEEEEEIPLSIFGGSTPSDIIRNKDKTIFFTGKNTKRMYTIDDGSMYAHSSTDSFSCDSILAVIYNIVFYNESGNNNYYSYDIGYKESSKDKADNQSSFSIAQSEIESEIEKIRTYYYSPSSGDTKKVIEKGQNNWNYSRDYRYHNGKLVFAFVFNGTEEHRLYFEDDHMIRYIDENHITYDYPNTSKYSSWEKKVLDEAY